MNKPTKKFLAAIALAAPLLAACSTAMPPATQEPVYAPRGACHIDESAWAVGKPVNEENGKRLFRESGAGLWRVVSPDQVIQKDKRGDRLTIYADASNIITSIACE